MAREFEIFKGRKFPVRKFYDQFKTCLPKIAMIVQGVRGNSNEDTFDQGLVGT
jgi:sulfur relay (sulfurtransferase) DsrC/TusE family protein